MIFDSRGILIHEEWYSELCMRQELSTIQFVWNSKFQEGYPISLFWVGGEVGLSYIWLYVSAETCVARTSLLVLEKC